MIPEGLTVTNSGWEFKNESDHFGAIICDGVISLPMGTLFGEQLQDYTPDAFGAWASSQP